ncbi:MAG TPA: M13 family metallopeptidase [Candidatus Ligilactobacillus excrementigallinarum]|uniref:M13 family metallopeptidase n=1 Tax=Candidatus Ligilactobacillus excrementigallinarum TaxID=2838641 RepID=A0A9D1UW73_9LACO|nr:M13 family metallopeptidase [Candidatus Ligilactobacillus excrementigallinarum]
MKYTAAVLGGAPVSDGEKASAKDNLYMHVNYDWLKKAKIPADKPAAGSFQDMDEAVEKQLIADFEDYHADKFSAPNSMFAEAMKMHALAIDFKSRKQQGVAPLMAVIKPIQKLNLLEDLSKQLHQWVLNALPLPFKIDVEPDWKDTSKNAVFLYGPDLILPDKTYYDKSRKDTPQLLATWSKMSQELLQLVGYDKTEAKQITKEALAFDQSLVQYVMTSEELADYPKQYNPKSLKEIHAYSQSFELDQMIQKLVDDHPEKVVVTQPQYFEAFDKLVNDSTFNQLKSWMLTKTINQLAPYLSDEIRHTADQFHKAVAGTAETLSQPKFAYQVIDDTFKYVIGDYYGRKYFGEDAKKDATRMIKEMIGIYKRRLQHNDWLGDQTRAKAILKLDKIAIKVGYPDKIKPVYAKLKVTPAKDGGTLLGNYVNIQKVCLQDNFEQYHQPVDRSEWDMPSQLVNACYDPSRNDITFPAAILEKPFYDLHQTHSQNFGGIGCVMGHEISHAFDNNGAHFDEYGNLTNWWTKEDSAHFAKLTQEMIDEFDGIPFAGGKVNGKLVVSENIADNGGMSCALEALKQYDDADMKAFFTNWATVWRMKASPAYKKMLLAIDVHAPQELRGNVQPQNFDEFYQAFDVHEGDGMWLEPDRRVKIW